MSGPSCKTLQVEALSEEQQEQYAAYARAWPTLCQGDDLEAHTGAPCDHEPFDASRYASASTLMDAYAAYHAYSLSPESAAGPPRTLVFVPNQYGLGNRLRAMKAALVVACVVLVVLATYLGTATRRALDDVRSRERDDLELVS